MNERHQTTRKVTAAATGKITFASWQSQSVFISSTFKDMQAERDHLRQVVFPRLQEELSKGRLLLELIDLRQGVETADIGSEEACERFVLKVCLDEIERSRPFLIVLLGDRYGWVPPEDRMAAATEEVGFAADVRDKSVTALEIEFGLLKRSSDQHRRSFFYFRDPLPYDRMPSDVAAIFSDEYSADMQTRARHGRLIALKQSLADDPELAHRVHSYHVEWEISTDCVSGLEVWGEQIYQHLLGELQLEIAAASSQPPQTWEDQERAVLAEFIEHRRRDFTGREQLLHELQTLAMSPSDGPLAMNSGTSWGACLTGMSGSGKSAIFAELVVRLSSDDSILLLTNAAGATPRGSQVDAMLERFIAELADAFGITKPLLEKATPDDVEDAFASLLHQVSAKRRVVVLLDAINQIDPTHRGQHLTWLRPKQWPGNARLIAIGLEGIQSNALSQWAGIEKRQVPPLTITDDGTDDVTAIAKAVWSRYHRQVNPAVLRVLKEKHLPDGSFAAANPLWLTLALEQINLLDADDFARASREFPGRPDERLRAMTVKMANDMPPTVAELYDLLLAQTERIFGIGPTWAFAAVIAVSRFGWRETDLLVLIPTASRILRPNEPVSELNDLRLAELRRSFRAHLVRRGTLGQIDFFHAQMRQAVERRVLCHLEQVRALHRAVADHLELLPPGDPLRASELMVHLIAGDDLPRAAHVYAELSDESAGLVATTQELAKHILLGSALEPNPNAVWVSQLVLQPNLSLPQVASVAHKFIFALENALEHAADLASRQLLSNAAKHALERLIASDPSCAEWQGCLSVSLNNLGDIASLRGNQREARSHFRDSHEIAQKLAEGSPNAPQWQELLAVSLSRLGSLIRNPDEAQRLLRESRDLWKRLTMLESSDHARYERNLGIVLHKLGELAIGQEDLTEAGSLFGESRDIALELLTDDPSNVVYLRDLALAWYSFGDLAISHGDLPEAQRLFGEAYLIAQRLAGSDPDNTEWQRDLSLTLIRLGKLAIEQENLADAHRLLSEANEIRQRLAECHPENLQWHLNLSWSLNALGELAITQGDRLEAQKLFGKSLNVLHRLSTSDPDNAQAQLHLKALFSTVRRLAIEPDVPIEVEQLILKVREIESVLDTDPGNAELQRDRALALGRLGFLASFFD